MAVTAPPVSRAAGPPGRRPVGRRPPIEVAALLAGTSLAVLVGLDGSPGWQAARILGVAGLTVGMLWALGRLGPRQGGRVAVAVGVVALAIAAGFAPHWAKGGPIPTQVAAMLLAVGAIGLAVGGAARATAGRRWWRRAGVGATVLVAAVVVASIVGPAVAATNVPRPQLGATPADAGLRYEDVSLRTTDGVALAAWYLGSSNRAAVVLLHGAGSTRSDVLDEAAVLARAGFGVLMVDARGHGQSGGRAMDFGWDGDADIAAATGYLARQPDVDPHRIGVVGLSMGGEEAIGASASDELIRAVVAEGATGRTASDDAWLSDQFGVRGLLQEQIERMQDRVTDLLTSASLPVSGRAAVEAADDTRYLLITAGDLEDEAHAAAHMSAGAPDRVATWTVPGAGHTGGLATAPQQWEDRVAGFLGEVLLTEET